MAGDALATDQTLGVVDGVGGVDSGLVLGSVTNQALAISERDVRRGNTVTLIVGDDLNTAVLVHTHARVGGAQIDTNHGAKLLLLGVNSGDRKQGHS